MFEDVPVQAISLELKTVTARGDLSDELVSEFDDTWIKVRWRHGSILLSVVACGVLFAETCI